MTLRWSLLTSSARMTHIAPTVQECTGADVAQLYMEHVFKHHGLVESIVSDRDPRFTGAVWSSIHKLMGTTLKMSTAAHPQTDGQSERAVRTVTEMLRSYAGHDEESWDQYLPQVEFAYNSSVNPSSGSHHSIWSMAGRLHLLWPDERGSRATAYQHDCGTRDHRVATSLKGGSREAGSGAAGSDQACQQTPEGWIFAVGDRVLLNAKNLRVQGPRKLKPRWLGPFTVLERVSPVNYRLLLPPELGTMHNVFHAAVLKPWKDDGRQPVARPGPVLVDGEQEYLVEAILAHRLIDAKDPQQGLLVLGEVGWISHFRCHMGTRGHLVQDVPDLLKAYQKEKTLFSSYPEAELPKLPRPGLPPGLVPRRTR